MRIYLIVTFRNVQTVRECVYVRFYLNVYCSKVLKLQRYFGGSQKTIVFCNGKNANCKGFA